MPGLREYLTDGAAELGLELGATELENFSLFAAELIKWNRKINLTAITDEKSVAVKHFLDSIAVMPYLDDSARLLDIGSGGGFPSIPLKIVAPAIEITSVDSIEKKINFQRHVVRKLKLENFTALQARGEDLAGRFPQKFTKIVSRAFASIPKFAAIAEPLLSPEGTIIAMKGSDGNREAEDAAASLHALGLRVTGIREFRLPFIGESRTLVLIRRFGS
jgi:16S rRNA (guanine527-N7)-methyltransferase